MQFNQLPTEIQLQILSQINSLPQENITTEIDKLSSYIVEKKIQHYLSNNEISLSIYSTNNQEINQKYQYNLIPNNNNDMNSNINFKLKELTSKNPVIPMSLNNNKPLFKSNDISKSHMDLIVNEDQSSIKFYLNLMINDKIISEFQMKSSIYLSNQSINISKNSKLDINLINMGILKDDNDDELLLNSNNYKFEESFKYEFLIDNLSINKQYLIQLLESQLESCIIRY
ncbi:hypothetical protein WICMUC_004199 [Wickerhamomyces mucosus]|uniref:Uncharacterized protein n=1 Tax=Wickerhamomyces mucosus TaxID=1378264 RepID=A0A9P8TBY8_9ASCO|nr:hypothetical protein WICMUC_004199 [Wickerhamomyces mucosus]